MHDRLKIDTDALRQSADRVSLIESALGSAAERAHELADVVGFEPLADRVVRFASNWGSRREELLAELVVLRESLRSGADEFESADSGLAAQVSGTA